RLNSSMSPTISTPAARASTALQCGSGWVSGTPGDSTKQENEGQSACRRSAVAMPARQACSTASLLSSQAVTRAPPAMSARAVASPDPPRPNSATLFPANVETGIIALSQLQRRKADQRQHHGDD